MAMPHRYKTSECSVQNFGNCVGKCVCDFVEGEGASGLCSTDGSILILWSLGMGMDKPTREMRLANRYSS